MKSINQEQEKQKIVNFLKETFEQQKIDKAVIGLSGGIDSTVSFFLLKEVLAPENIIVAHLYYQNSFFAQIEKIVETASVPQANIHQLSIKESVDMTAALTEAKESKIRLGNIAARTRMIILFDLAKKHNALVCGTENKSENLLSYFTRFGDQASDIEPIAHLYKTQVFDLAKYLGVPDEIVNQHPSANLWANQTDEGEFGFSYEEADQVLSLSVDEGKSLEELEKLGFTNARKILEWKKRNWFKHKVPYTL